MNAINLPTDVNELTTKLAELGYRNVGDAQHEKISAWLYDLRENFRIPLAATEAQLYAFLKDKAASYGIPGLTLMLADHGRTSSKPLCIIANHPQARHYGSGDTIDLAVEDVRGKIETPKTKAARLRAEADKLIAEATAAENAAEKKQEEVPF